MAGFFCCKTKKNDILAHFYGLVRILGFINITRCFYFKHKFYFKTQRNKGNKGVRLINTSFFKTIKQTKAQRHKTALTRPHKPITNN